MLDVFFHGVAGDGETVCLNEAGAVQFFHDRLNPACPVQIFKVVRSTGTQRAQMGRDLADLVDFVEIDFNVGLICQGRQVKHGIGGASKGHVYHQSILKRLLGHNF